MNTDRPLPSTPVTDEGLEQYDHLDPVEAVALAYAEAGPHPYWHRRARAELRRILPVLARALDRLTGPGPHERITTTVGVAGRLWNSPDDTEAADFQRRARRDVRRRWAADLDERGLRPLGWPPIGVIGYRYPDVPITDSTQRGDGDPWPEVPLEDADLVHVTITGYAVPVAQ